jgi:SAM-dependent methyltransferase
MSSQESLDALASYLEEAVSRATGNPDRAVAAGGVPEPARPVASTSPSMIPGRIGRRLAGNRAGHALRVLTGTAEHLAALRAELDSLGTAHHRTWQAAERVGEQLGDLRQGIEHRIATMYAAIAGLELAVDELGDEIDRIALNTAGVGASLDDGDDLDSFYEEFELRFRGATEDVKRRLERWVPFLDQLPRHGEPVLDIGSGRGEWLALLRESGIRAHGVDLNARFAAQCADDGLDVIRADAFDYLTSLPEGSLGTITAFQFVEHLSPAQTLRLLRLAHRALRPGGRLLLETPNPSNLRVAAFTFYLDPTHERPVHPELLGFAVERAGFVAIERHFANPALDAPDVSSEIDPESQPQLVELMRHLHWALFGPQDYAIAALKPQVDA